MSSNRIPSQTRTSAPQTRTSAPQTRASSSAPTLHTPPPVTPPAEETTADKLKRVGIALEKVPIDIRKDVYAAASATPEMEIVQQFNDTASKLLSIIKELVKGRSVEKEIDGSTKLFNLSIKKNMAIAIDNFTMTILMKAADIYDENESAFLEVKMDKMAVKDGSAIIDPELFKDLWKLLQEEKKELIRNTLIELTWFSHMYFYKLIQNLSQ